MAIPGCWPKGLYLDNILNRIDWRFCGGFFLGSMDKLYEFCVKADSIYHDTVKNGNIVWEVNIWATLEEKGWNPNGYWYWADHKILY